MNTQNETQPLLLAELWTNFDFLAPMPMATRMLAQPLGSKKMITDHALRFDTEIRNLGNAVIAATDTSRGTLTAIGISYIYFEIDQQFVKIDVAQKNQQPMCGAYWGKQVNPETPSKVVCAFDAWIDKHTLDVDGQPLRLMKHLPAHRLAISCIGTLFIVNDLVEYVKVNTPMVFVHHADGVTPATPLVIDCITPIGYSLGFYAID